MATLKRLLPSRLATAMSKEPMRAAVTETVISGNDVVIAMKDEPTKLSPQPVCVAICSASPGRKHAAMMITIELIAKKTAALRRLD